MGPGSIQLVDRGQRSHAREAPARSSPAAPEVTGSAGITVVVTVGADEAIRSFLDQELEVCGGLYGHTINGEIVVEQATLIRRDSRCRNRHRDKEQHMTDKPDPDALHIAIESFLGQLDDGQPIVVAKGSKWKGEFVRRYSTFFVDAATADEPEIARKRAALQQ